jgi:ubiquinone/menaquinone biosynthesis C-methylase UbiE
MEENYLEINKNSWNERATVHYDSKFYDVKSFIKGRTSLNEIELSILGDLKGKKILHLQCHFGQDTISLNRMGAEVVGVDFSDVAINQAENLAKETNSTAQFICSDIYSLPEILNEKFDMVFTSYGTIGWLPDIDKWAKVVTHFLKPGGQFVFAEFHPVVWMFDDNFKEIKYKYFNADPIIDLSEGTYTDGAEDVNLDYISWNHGIGDVVTSLISNGMEINGLKEFDYSPYNCFSGTEELTPGKFNIKVLGSKIPMVYSILATMK